MATSLSPGHSTGAGSPLRLCWWDSRSAFSCSSWNDCRAVCTPKQHAPGRQEGGSEGLQGGRDPPAPTAPVRCAWEPYGHRVPCSHAQGCPALGLAAHGDRLFGHMVLWVGLCPCGTAPVVPTASWQQGRVLARLTGLGGLSCPSGDVPRGTHGPGEAEPPLV